MWIYERSNYLLNIDMQRAILGVTNVTENNKPINYIFILTRYYIYKCRINGNRPSITEWTRTSVHRTRMPPPNAIQKKGLYVIVTGIP